MPHSARLVINLNDLFSQPLSDEHREVIRSGEKLVDTLSELGILEGVPSGDVEVLATSLGESVQAGILASIKSGAERDLPVVFQWQAAQYGSVSLFEAVDEGVGMIGCNVRAPWLRHAIIGPRTGT